MVQKDLRCRAEGTAGDSKISEKLAASLMHKHERSCFFYNVYHMH